ncbi:uncharacterized protein N7496_001776 [Penicillium cataractarum]|uniref:Uncharacterized protein n=1 Tax=Penicillium cataractarum TaxID=2100454 RepID=A0A9X0B778_9EURO|nr:uncharacterized protein N7496_001776 [Penicillium cataractarum]KAJ5390708.1 hypothetical protein N7496_001776 [Penicillium cataractarum]
MAKSPASNDASTMEAPTSSVLTIRAKPATKQKLPATPTTSSPRSSAASTPNASNNAKSTRPRKDHTPPMTNPKPVTPMTPHPVIPKLTNNTEAATKTRKMKHEVTLKAQIEDLKRQIAERDAQIMWLKVELQSHVARQFFG